MFLRLSVPIKLFMGVISRLILRPIVLNKQMSMLMLTK